MTHAALPAGWGARMKATAVHRALGVLVQYLTVELNNLSCAFKQTGAPGPCSSDRPYFAGSDAVVLQLRQLELVPHGEASALWFCASGTKCGENDGCMEGLQKCIAQVAMVGDVLTWLTAQCVWTILLQQRQLEVVSLSKAQLAVCVEGHLACTGGPCLDRVLCRIGQTFHIAWCLVKVSRQALQLRQLKLCLAWPALHTPHGVSPSLLLSLVVPPAASRAFRRMLSGHLVG